MRLRLSALDAPLTVQFEPSGMEYELSPGQYLDIEPAPVAAQEIGGYIEHAPGMVTVSVPGPGFARAWNEEGLEVTT